MSPHSLVAPSKPFSATMAEFDNASSRAFFTTKGVLLQMSCPYTSPQNNIAERILHTINNMLCSLLFQASIPARYWVEECNTPATPGLAVVTPSSPLGS
jgi:hypothetical protein